MLLGDRHSEGIIQKLMMQLLNFSQILQFGAVIHASALFPYFACKNESPSPPLLLAFKTTEALHYKLLSLAGSSLQLDRKL